MTQHQPRRLPINLGPLLSLIDQGLISGASFLTTVAIARWGGTAAMGIFSMLWGVMLMLRATQGDLVTAPYNIFSQRFHGPKLAEYNASTLLQEGALIVAALLIFAGLLTAAWLGWLSAGTKWAKTAVLTAKNSKNR